jgi:serine/threonine protein phosphatase PrpC
MPSGHDVFTYLQTAQLLPSATPQAIDVLGRILYGEQYVYAQIAEELQEYASLRKAGNNKVPSTNAVSPVLQHVPEGNLLQVLANGQEWKQEEGVLEVGEGYATVSSEDHPEHNEDRRFSNKTKRNLGVADGVGGYPEGEQAASIAQGSIIRALDDVTQNPVFGVTEVRQAFRNAFYTAHLKIKDKINEIKKACEQRKIPVPKDLERMATAVVAAQVVNNSGKETVVYAQAGDVRLYVVKKDGSLHRITRDQGVLPDDIADKADTASSVDEVRALGDYWGKRGHIINSIGANVPDPNIDTYDLQSDDLMLLVTSDGIHDNLTPGEIEAYIKEELRQNSNRQVIPSAISKRLVVEAHKRSLGKTHPRSKPDDKTAQILLLTEEE